MKAVIKYTLLSFSMILMLCFIVFTMWYFSVNKEEKVCTEFEISISDSEKSKLISQTEVAVILDQNSLNPIGKSLKRIKSESIEKILHKNKMIKCAECFKSPSGLVKINIKQRIPKFRVVGMGSYYVDADRKIMPVSPNFAAYVPVVSGRVTVSFATGKLFDFVTFLDENPFWNAQIEQIYVCDDLKIELVPRVGDAIIVLGTLANYTSKLEKLRKLYVYGFNEFGWNRYERIDLQYKNQVVCTKVGEEPRLPKLVAKVLNDSIIPNKL